MRRGFTLVEVVVALVILEVGLIGSLGLVATASHTLARAERLEWETAVVEGIADSLATAPDPAGGRRPLDGGGAVVWSVAADGAFAVWIEGGPLGAPSPSVAGTLPPVVARGP